jgi:hypothetical protein
MKQVKYGNWQIKCGHCMIVLFLNSTMSMNLFRGMQTFFNDNPQHQITHTEGIVRNAPNEGD